MEENTPVSPGTDAAMNATTDVYSTMSALDIFNDTREAPPEVWGGLQLAPGYIMEIIGPAGLGKSRLLLNLAINQILGRPFADLPVYDQPLSWLFYGNENSFYRFRFDLQRMFSILNDEERKTVGKYLFLPTMEKPHDCYISFADGKNREKFYNTIILRDASVVVMDPWGAIINGDECNDQDVRKTIQDIAEALRKATAKLGHPVVGIILNHSRNGLKEMVNACGPNAANYGKNSKAVHSVVRVVWNLRIGTVDTPCNKIELLHVKGNDRKLYDPVFVELNEHTMCYNFIQADHDLHQAMLEKMEHIRSQMSPEEKKAAEQKLLDNASEQILKHIQAVGSESRKDLEAYTDSIRIGRNRASSLLANLVENNKVRVLIDKHNHHVVCDIAKVEEFLSKAEPGFYRIQPTHKEAMAAHKVPHDDTRELPLETSADCSCAPGSADGE